MPVPRTGSPSLSNALQLGLSGCAGLWAGYFLCQWALLQQGCGTPAVQPQLVLQLLPPSLLTVTHMDSALASSKPRGLPWLVALSASVGMQCPGVQGPFHHPGCQSFSCSEWASGAPLELFLVHTIEADGKMIQAPCVASEGNKANNKTRAGGILGQSI